MNNAQKIKFLLDADRMVDEATYGPGESSCIITQMAREIKRRDGDEGFLPSVQLVAEEYDATYAEIERIYLGVCGWEAGVSKDGKHDKRREDWEQLGETKHGALQIIRECLGLSPDGPDVADGTVGEELVGDPAAATPAPVLAP